VSDVSCPNSVGMGPLRMFVVMLLLPEEKEIMKVSVEGDRGGVYMNLSDVRRPSSVGMVPMSWL